jgi:hypothetical protein
MTHDDARRLLSDRVDGELAPDREAALDAHLAGCPSCQAYLAGVQQVRSFLQQSPTPRPDLTASIMTAVRREQARADPPSRPRRLLPVAAAFVAAALAGAVLVGSADRGSDGVAAADLLERLAEAQTEAGAVSATVHITERGWHPEVPERRFEGPLRYLAPESLSLELVDQTRYPSGAWPANDVVLAVHEDTWEATGLRDCPVVVQPGCLSPEPEVRAVKDREPFSAATPVPLDLITPVQSFLLSGMPVTLADRQIDGRDTLGVQVTAAQVEPLLSGLRPAGNLRQVHPGDLVELRLDEQTLLPLAVTVRAAEGALRQQWADRHGYADAAGDVVLEMVLSDVRLGSDAEPAAAPGSRPEGSSAGFTDGPVSGAPSPSEASLGSLEPHRSGVLHTPDGPAVAVRTWSDGRAWLSVRSTEQWSGGRLFGDLGEVVRVVDLDGSVGYLSEDGATVGVHSDLVDVVITGSVDQERLIQVAASLGVDGLVVPEGWAEAATASADEAAAALGTLQLPEGLDGFGQPSFRIDGAVATPTVRAAFAGPGERAFVLAQSAGDRLTPPLDTADVTAVGVPVAGQVVVAGRYSPERGLLEWVDGGTVRSLGSSTIGLPELLAIADGLQPA